MSTKRALKVALLMVLLVGASWARPLQIRIPSRVRISSKVAELLLIKRVNPIYPAELRKQGVQGTVTLYVLISKEGDVVDAKLIAGQPALAQLAIDAVKQWKYKPYLLNREPAEVETQMLVNFSLADN